MAHTTVITDGAFDWADGVDSNKVPTLQSSLVPNGLKRSQLAWLVNGTVKDGAISPRAGWKKLAILASKDLIYQGGYMYNPVQGNPELILSLNGNIMKVDFDPITAQNLTIDISTYTAPNPGPWTVTLA